MKKVLILAAALALFATPAMAAGIFNTKHNLSSAASSDVTRTYYSTNLDEVCVFCHTPHGAQSLDNAPLWNRDLTDVGTLVAADLYNSLTLQSGSRPTAVATAVNTSDAPLCLSCHDGASMDNTLTNPPNVLGGDALVWNGGAANIPGTSEANLDDGSTMLSNDHPIGMDYQTVATADGELNTAATITGTGVTGGLTLYGGKMWCSSCHDVHTNDNGVPFLAKNNAASALCTTCHVK